jgi:hypothetical protein
MRARRCTIDSACVIALDHLDLVPQLSFLFSIVLVPKAVREDLFKRRVTKSRCKLSLRLRPSFNVATATTTGRLTSYVPNEVVKGVRIAVELRRSHKHLRSALRSSLMILGGGTSRARRP